MSLLVVSCAVLGVVFREGFGDLFFFVGVVVAYGERQRERQTTSKKKIMNKTLTAEDGVLGEVAAGADEDHEAHHGLRQPATESDSRERRVLPSFLEVVLREVLVEPQPHALVEIRLQHRLDR